MKEEEETSRTHKSSAAGSDLRISPVHFSLRRAQLVRKHSPKQNPKQSPMEDPPPMQQFNHSLYFCCATAFWPFVSKSNSNHSKWTKIPAQAHHKFYLQELGPNSFMQAQVFVEA